MKITSAEFVASAWRPFDFPKDPFPEVAFAGKSNVGKSSLINVLLNRKKLVKTSSTPGKTQSINFFRVNNKTMFVDLPGYGFAKVPLAVRKKWKPLVEGYLINRKDLKLVVLILDVRRVPSLEDKELLRWFDLYNIPAVVVLSKVDKLSKTKSKKQIEIVKRSLPKGTEIIPFSAITREGKEDVWEQILLLTGI